MKSLGQLAADAFMKQAVGARALRDAKQLMPQLIGTPQLKSVARGLASQPFRISPLRPQLKPVTPLTPNTKLISQLSDDVRKLHTPYADTLAVSRMDRNLPAGKLLSELASIPSASTSLLERFRDYFRTPRQIWQHRSRLVDQRWQQAVDALHPRTLRHLTESPGGIQGLSASELAVRRAELLPERASMLIQHRLAAPTGWLDKSSIPPLNARLQAATLQNLDNAALTGRHTPRSVTLPEPAADPVHSAVAYRGIPPGKPATIPGWPSYWSAYPRIAEGYARDTSYSGQGHLFAARTQDLLKLGPGSAHFHPMAGQDTRNPAILEKVKANVAAAAAKNSTPFLWERYPAYESVFTSPQPDQLNHSLFKNIYKALPSGTGWMQVK